MSIPTEADWGDWRSDLDQADAHESFAGKSSEEVLPLFRASLLWHTGALRFMPAVPFRYYMLAFKQYVLSEAAVQDEVEAASAADCFVGLVESRLREDVASIAPIIEELRPAVEFVATNQSRYHAPVSIYGSFGARLERIDEMRRRLTTE
jgi:hypothetical protein